MFLDSVFFVKLQLKNVQVLKGNLKYRIISARERADDVKFRRQLAFLFLALSLFRCDALHKISFAVRATKEMLNKKKRKKA